MTATRVISADCHVNEPPWVFDRVPAAFRDRAPRMMRGADGGDGWSFDGKPPTRTFGVEAMAGRQKGDYKRAVEELERAVNLTGSDPTITEHLGDAYRKLGKVKEAGNEYSDALKKSQETDQVARLKDKIQVLQNAASAVH